MRTKDVLEQAYQRGLNQGCFAAIRGYITPKQATAWYVRGLVEDFTLEEDPISGHIFRRLHEYSDRILEMKYRRGYLTGVHAFIDGWISLDEARRIRRGKYTPPVSGSVEDKIKYEIKCARWQWDKLHGKEIGNEISNTKKRKKNENRGID